MKFTKMHGLGNDYIYVNTAKEPVADAPALAKRLSDRHFGVGSDGLILINPSSVADFEMEMYNADGSRGKMCGNGIRCVGKYVYDRGLTDRTHLTIETLAGIRTLDMTAENGKVTQVRVDMGAPVFEPALIPVNADGDRVLDQEMSVAGGTWRISCVSMGNPHCIVPVDDPDTFDLEHIGPRFESDPLFPERVNTEFIRVEDEHTVRMRVWERGSGETFACGTGACAVAVACAANGWTQDTVRVRLRGGDLTVEWDRAHNTVYMTGPATTVFEGEIEV